MSEGIEVLIAKEGLAGYGRWFRLLEIIAFKMDETNKCSVEYPMQKWCSLLGLKQKKLISFLELTENQLKTKVVNCENKIRIEIPNLLKKRDKYTRDLQKKGKQLTPKIEEVEVDKEKEEDKSPKSEFSDDSLEMALSQKLMDLIIQNSPKAKIKPDSLQKWASDVGRMQRLDNRTEEEIERLICWSQAHSCWRSNIRSMGKLREKFDTLELQMSQDTTGEENTLEKLRELDDEE